MAVIGRIFLFLLVNALVVLSLSVITSLLGIRPYLTSYGINYTQLALFCLVWGSGGAFISLLMSRAIAKWTAGVQVIDPNTQDPTLRQLISIIYELCRRAGLQKMPEVGIYDSPDVNAFATGPSSSMALVAVSTGLLSRMNQQEIAGVLGHEITHITNGDMVTMTLLQGIVNAFVMFLSRVLAFILVQSRRDSDGRRSFGFMYYLVEIALQIVFMILGSIVVAWFSRWREYRADAGGAHLAGKENMISALKELQRVYDTPMVKTDKALQTLQISSRSSGLMTLFASHPPLASRIAKLEKMTNNN